MARRHTLRKFILCGAIWGTILIAASAITIWHVIGWLIATAITCSIAFTAGFKSRRVQLRSNAKLIANAGYGKADRYRGGSFPTEPVTDMDARSTYPDMPDDFARASRKTAPVSQFPFTSIAFIVPDVTAALITLGWARVPAREAAQAAYIAVSNTGVPVSVQSVLARALRTAGEASPKSRKVVPGESA